MFFDTSVKDELRHTLAEMGRGSPSDVFDSKVLFHITVLKLPFSSGVPRHSPKNATSLPTPRPQRIFTRLAALAQRNFAHELRRSVIFRAYPTLLLKETARKVALRQMPPARRMKLGPKLTRLPRTSPSPAPESVPLPTPTVPQTKMVTAIPVPL